jgi:hypothetical protein
VNKQFVRKVTGWRGPGMVGRAVVECGPKGHSYAQPGSKALVTAAPYFSSGPKGRPFP